MPLRAVSTHSNLRLRREDAISLSQITQARNSLRGVIVETELRRLDWIQKREGYEVYAKLEHAQKTGSYKIRGAYHRLSYQRPATPIIAASAGNHGLAVAAAGHWRGLETTICIPSNASSVKKERIAAFHSAMILQGTSVEEATQYAKEIAFHKGWDFISPFNDPLIITGQGTVALELLEQLPGVDVLLVPVGGGGLISGVAVAAKSMNSRIKVIGVEPANYASVTASLSAGSIQRVPNQPTLADGLAANLERNSITFTLIQKWVDGLLTVSEEEIAAAVLTLLYRESLLVEPAAAVGLAAILAGKIPSEYGRVALLLTGGNVSTATISRIINYPFRNSELLRFANRLGEKAEHKTIIRGISPAHGRVSLPVQPEVDDRQANEVAEDLNFLRTRLKSVRESLDAHGRRFDDYIAYCRSQSLMPNQAALEAAQPLRGMLQKLVEAQEQRLNFFLYSGRKEFSRFVISVQQAYRTMLHMLVPLNQAMDWLSPSYAQSVEAQFFGLESQENPGCNYNRYESLRVSQLEQQTVEILGVDTSIYSLFLTSSGMAAYSLLESFLLRYALEAGDTVLLPHYIYFEADEQIAKLPYFRIERNDLFETASLVSFIREKQPRVVFLDPMTNTPDLRMTDVEAVIRGVDELPLRRDLYVVVDGTMLSGSLAGLFQRPLRNPRLHVLYYESCSKYLQLGLDATMAGLVLVPLQFQGLFERLRRNTGAILYNLPAVVFPRYQRDEHEYRMERFTRNACLIAEMIENAPSLTGYVQVTFPLLPRHPDYAVARRMPYIGGLVTFSFGEGKLAHRDELNALIEIIVDTCKHGDIPITKGVSFGFSVPRISAASALAESAPPFLRLSVGDRTVDETRALGQALIASIERYRRNLSMTD